MSILTCAEVRELAPELALGILGGAERAEVVLHVNGCARCQAYVAELTEAADLLPQLVPEAEPPAGFEARTLRRFGADDRQRRRRWIASVAAVAAAVAIVSITTVRVIESGDDTTSVAQTPITSGSRSLGVPVAVKMEGGTVPAPRDGRTSPTVTASRSPSTTASRRATTASRSRRRRAPRRPSAP